MDSRGEIKQVAAASLAGDCHTAFTAGVLKRLLQEQQANYEWVGFSGASGGAICALLYDN